MSAPDHTPERDSPLLFSPFRLRRLELENRIVVSPMCQYAATEGLATPWHLIHIGGLALSGAGLVILEATATEARGRISKGCLGLYSDAHEAALRDLLVKARLHGRSAIGVQLGHAGRRASCRSISERWRGDSLSAEEGAWQTIGPSALPYDDGWHTPLEASEADIAEIIASFAQAAGRAERAGFDMIEIHAAHGYLLHQFLSPLTNHRTDRWGGTQAGRNRLCLEVARAVRAAVSADFPVGIRMNSTDWHPDGLTLEDAVALTAELRDLGMDYAVMSAGNLSPLAKIPRATPGHQVEFAARVRRETGIAAMAVGFILDGPQAEQILRRGEADLIAVGRGFLDDPRWAWHAAAELGADVSYPAPYIRARPNNWTGYELIHQPTAAAISGRQADRPAAGAWDRPVSS